MEQGWAKFVSGEAEGKWLIWQITIFCDNQVQLAIIDNKQSPSSFFDKFLWEAAIFRQEQSQEGEKCAFIYAWAEYPTQLDDILCMSRPLFVGSYLQVTWWALGQWKGRTIWIVW